MKIKLTVYLLPLALLVAFACVLFNSKTDAATQEPNRELKLEVFTPKESYLPGEVIDLQFKATNTSGEAITFAKTDVYRGNLEVYVAYEDGAFRKYRGPQWGLRDAMSSRPLNLEPGKTYETQATLLFNHAIPTKHLTKMYADQIQAENVDTDYALDQAGIYYIKAVLHRGENQEEIESQPLAVNILEPQGLDSEVWQRLKANPEIGYLLQTGSMRRLPSDPRTKHATEVLEQISQEFSGSSYGENIKVKLMRYRESLARLREKGLLRNQ